MFKYVSNLITLCYSTVNVLELLDYFLKSISNKNLCISFPDIQSQAFDLKSITENAHIKTDLRTNYF